MIKHGDPGLASLAADRSMRAALASGSPVAIASSARIVTHALMNGGHHASAVAMATSYASRLDRDLPDPTPSSLSVYGALLLRGAVASAQDDNRVTAHELLAEAEDTARRLGQEANHCWTAFGPVNATLHRVNIAVTLGDAGTAIDLARSIHLDAIAVTERKATLLIDTARAFLQRHRHENAYLAIRAAHQTAPEEVTGRAAVRDLVRDLVRELAATAPPTVRRDATQFAAASAPPSDRPAQRAHTDRRRLRGRPGLNRHHPDRPGHRTRGGPTLSSASSIPPSQSLPASQRLYLRRINGRVVLRKSGGSQRQHTGRVRITIRVRPGSAHPGAGGEYAGALIVRVSARAVDGKATEAALAAVAGAFGVRRSAVTLVSGASSRTKIVDIAEGDPRILAALMADPGRGVR
jgi:uncharacterized protein YggU (UPF0235/DUF167 family)